VKAHGQPHLPSLWAPSKGPASEGFEGRILGPLLVLALAVALAGLPISTLLTAGLPVLALFIFRHPSLGLALVAFGVPFGSLLALPLGGGALTPTPLILAWTAFACALSLLAGQSRRPARSGLTHPIEALLTVEPRLRGPLIGLGVFSLALLAAAWSAPNALAAGFEIARWFELALALVLATCLGLRATTETKAAAPGGSIADADSASVRRLNFVLLALLAAGGTQALLGLWMALSRIGPEPFAVLGGRLYRAHGSFGQPNPFAGYMNMIWPLGLGLLLYRLIRPGIGRGLLLAGLASALMSGFALIASWSRGGWLAAAAGAAAMALLWLASAIHDRRSRARGLWLAWAAGILLFLALLGGAVERLPAGLTHRLASVGQTERIWGLADAEVNDANFSTIERVAHWEAALGMWSERPWLGQGPGHYELSYARFQLPRWSAALGHAHNIYLNFLAETGLVGLAAFLGFWLSLLIFAAGLFLAPRSPLQGALGLGLFGILVATSVHGLLDNLFVHEMTLHLGLVAGLAAAAGRVSTSQISASPQPEPRP
jgi:O-antigen ligase